ncbi:MAG: PD-(D/E)XK nuclease family protein [Pirellulales bacterium]
MPLTRIFLDIHRPALGEAVAYLRQRYGRAAAFDLSQVIVVVPGSRAGRRLLELLVDAAERERLALAPPAIVTLSALPERLYQPQRPFATPLTQQLAWARALRETPSVVLRSLLPRPPESPDDPAWLEWGEMLRREHSELAADALDFAHVQQELPVQAGAAEAARWRALADIQQRYLALLDSLELWDLQTARLIAVQRREFQTTLDLVLLGVVDLNRTQRAMLDQVADRVTALVPAAPDWADRFDLHGCLRAEVWNDPARAPLTLSDEQLRHVDGPGEQAEEVVRCLAEWGGRYQADEITIGFPDETLVPQVERQLRQCGLPARWGPGRPLEGTRPFRLLTTLADWLEQDGYAAWAALLRHPDVAQWLSRQGHRDDWLLDLDRFYNEHLPQRLDVELLQAAAAPRSLLEVQAAVNRWLDKLRGPARSLAEWSAPLYQAITEIYATELDLGTPDDATVWRACEQIRETLTACEHIPEALRPRVTAAAAVRLIVQQSAGAMLPAPSDVAAIELLGWLELPLDDAPALIVTSCNDGHVPRAVNADPFLPNSLRVMLGLDDNARRFARDAYAASVLHASRRELVWLIARRDAQGNPAVPSRLLFSTDPATVARRALRLFAPPPPVLSRGALPGEFRPRRATSTFAPPPPEAILERFPDCLREPLQLSVSDFKTYLACPYRFLLAKATRCEVVTDEARELDGGLFGSLAHDVLSQFGESELRHSTDAAAIREFLRQQLQHRVERQFGQHPRPAVQVQAEQLRLRLAAFADIQAERAAAGWQIALVEHGREQQQVRLTVDGQPFDLVGRIDRIDRHTVRGHYAIFDYKTSDHGDGPRETHVDKSGRWTDLQLPLYRYLAQSPEICGPWELGYIVLPKDVAHVACVPADWSDEELAEADAAAWEVVRRIRQRDFAMSPEFRSGRYDDYARICLASVLK